MNCAGRSELGMLVCVETNSQTAIRILAPTDGDDAGLVAELADLINSVYQRAENGLWREGTTRTTIAELARFIAAGEIVVARRHGRLAGSVRVHEVAPGVTEFGLLVAAPEYRGAGVGRALVDFAEQRAHGRGMRAMQLELLVPRTWRHPSKEFLSAWYGRRGYRVINTRSVDDAYPHLAPLLATSCDLLVYEKPLRATDTLSGMPQRSADQSITGTGE
jgi:GNAT superfamily N-acetyltransferase